MRPVLILRPEPGADETAARAAQHGFAPIVAPLFVTRPRAWDPPDPAAFEAVMLTSANAARHGGDGLTSFLRLPCYVVGEATARAARAAGFADLRVGPSDGAALLEQMAADGIGAAIHPCGEQHAGLGHPQVRITDIPVYAAEPVGRLAPEAEAALRADALVLLHSPRAAALFASLAGEHKAAIEIAAISDAAAAAAGAGWKAVTIAAAPRDEALLELAAKLCQTGRG